MQFTPKSKDEIKRENLLAAGIYDFTVLKAENRDSKKGNPMIALSIEVFGPDDAHGFVNDYLMEAVIEKMYAFCEAVGLLEKYHVGSLEAEDCEGKSGKLKLIIKEDKTGEYGPQNNVRSYLPPNVPAVIAETMKAEEEESPFLK